MQIGNGVVEDIYCTFESGGLGSEVKSNSVDGVLQISNGVVEDVYCSFASSNLGGKVKSDSVNSVLFCIVDRVNKIVKVIHITIVNIPCIENVSMDESEIDTIVSIVGINCITQCLEGSICNAIDGVNFLVKSVDCSVKFYLGVGEVRCGLVDGGEHRVKGCVCYLVEGINLLVKSVDCSVNLYLGIGEVRSSLVDGGEHRVKTIVKVCIQSIEG